MLSKGANTVVPTAALQVSLRRGQGPELDLAALLLGEDGRVRDDCDFVFYNQPTHASGAVQHGRVDAATDGVLVDLSRVEPAVGRIVLSASASGRPFREATAPQLTVTGPDGAPTEVELALEGNETAIVAAELYRRGDGWKLRAVSQGYATGLAGLAMDFGISVEDDEDDAPATPPQAPQAPAQQEPTTPPAPAPAAAPPAPSGGPLNLDKGTVNLRKSESVSLVKQGAPPLTTVQLGLGWDPAKRGRSIDLDASAIAFNAAGKAVDKVWFFSQKGCGGAIRHSGDNLTGDGDGDDEVITVDLPALPTEVVCVAFTINSFSGQKFTEIARAYCRLLDGKQELVRFELTDSQPETGVLMTALWRQPDGTWSMRAIGEFHAAKTVRGMVKPARKLLFG